MIKEPPKIDFYTTGKQPTEKDFTRISDWIKKDKKRKEIKKEKGLAEKKKTWLNIAPAINSTT
jgi:hypothetical protein